MLPVELAALRFTVAPWLTVVLSAVATATSGSGAVAVPVASIGTVIVPPAVDSIVTLSGGDVMPVMLPAPVALSVVWNTGTLSIGAVDDLSLLRPLTVIVLVVVS